MRLSLVISLIYLNIIPHILMSTNAITYNLSQGRFGDHVLAFSKALYLGHTYQMRTIYVPFEYSDQLKMDTDPYLSHIKVPGRARIIRIQKDTYIHPKDEGHIIYMADLGTKKDGLTHLDSIYECMVHDSAFETILKQMLTPRVPIFRMTLPENIITVALHVRKGGGFDKPLISAQLNKVDTRAEEITYCIPRYFQYSDQRWPHKFPPDQYYIDQLLFLSELLHNQPLYVYLFTDDPHPQKLATYYEKILNKPNIFIDCRSEKNRHNMNVLDDYWNMAQFDCLIRAASNFSRAVQLLGNHKIVLFTKHAQWIDDRVMVDKIGVVVRNKAKDIFISKSLPAHGRNEKLMQKIQEASDSCFN